MEISNPFDLRVPGRAGGGFVTGPLASQGAGQPVGGVRGEGLAVGTRLAPEQAMAQLVARKGGGACVRQPAAARMGRGGAL